MTGVRELIQVRVVSAAPEHVRLSVLGERTQLDISLPLDVTVADAVPELVRLVQSRGKPNSRADEAAGKDVQRNYWALGHPDSEDPLPSDMTLREAGVGNGALLRLFDERALSAPTLYDDVVDAAARLNKASFAGWDGTAAKWMAFVGVQLTALALLYCLASPAFKPHRIALVGISIVVALALVGVAALAHRSYRQSTAGAVLGWAAIPICAGVVWALCSGAGGYVLAGGCAGLVVVMFALYRAVGTGHWGYLSGAVFFGLSGVALVVFQLGVRVDIVGSGLAIVGTLSCLAVPRLTAALAYAKPAKAPAQPQREEPLFENPFAVKSADQASGDTQSESEEPGGSAPTAEDVWNRVRSARLTRSAMYTGLATSAALGGAVVLRSHGAVQWSTLVFALTCAATLGLFTRRPDTAVERAALAVPAIGLLAFTGWAAQSAHQPIPLVGMGILLLVTVAFAAVGLVQPSGPKADEEPGQSATVLAYLDYGASVALFPLAMWVVGVYGQMGS